MGQFSEIYEAFLRSAALITDTRKLVPNSFFVALRGPNFDGNAFVADALASGARYALSSDPTMASERVWVVPDTLVTLQELARYHRSQWSIPVVAFTGSNGKTTSKELLASVLGQKYLVGATEGNLNNHIGVPLTILNLPKGAEIALIEMGANHQKEIEQLSAIAQPDYGFITNYGKAHLEGFGGVEGIIKGKSELYDYLRSAGKSAFIHCADQKQWEKSEGIAYRYSFGNCPDAQFVIEPAQPNEEGLEAIRVGGLRMQSQLMGAYNFGNLAVAAAVGQFFQVPLAQIKKGIESYQPQNNRSQRVQVGRNTLIKDYYNANPNSMAGALENLQTLAGSTKWAILGDMYELGEAEDAEHQAIVDQVAAYGLEKVLLIGTAFGRTRGVGERFPDTAAAITYLRSLKPEGKTILIKGSRGMKLEQVAALFHEDL